VPWINLNNINLIEFRRGTYKPPEYHDIIKYSRDARFIYPRVIEPLSCNFQMKDEIRDFFKKYSYRFHIKPDISDVIPFSFMPGPGEIRPTHVVLRYDLISESRDILGQAVLKIVNSKYGYQEYRKQQKLYNLGYPTPEPFYYCNYFTDFQDIFKNKNDIRDPDAWRWISSLLREIETGIRLFSDLKKHENNVRIQDFIKKELENVDEDDRFILTKFLDDLQNIEDGIFDGLEFKGFFFMDYIEHSLSFEMITFDLLGGMEMEKKSNCLKLMHPRPILDENVIIEDVVDLILRLWNLDTCHNDLKGEHFLYDIKKQAWNVIDWGELVGGSKGKDLAVLLADTNSFIQDRCNFNLMFGRKQKSEKIYEDLLEMERKIMINSDHFWNLFLDHLGKKIKPEIFKEAATIIKSRSMSFNSEKLKKYYK